jgi:hypothetical protein
MIRVSEVIRGWFGWCPARMMAPHFIPFQESNPVSSVFSGERGYTMQDVIMDYGSTGISIQLFTIILAGTIAGLFAIMRYDLFESWSSPGLLILIVFILGVVLRMLHQDIKKATVEFAPDAIIIRRPLFRPVIIAKGAITTMEVRKNFHHSHRWLSRGATMIVLAGIIPTILSSGQSLFISRLISRVSFSIFVVFCLAVVVFFGFVIYHGYIRSRYADVLAICTNNKKIIGLYVDDPGKISDMLSRWRGEGV